MSTISKKLLALAVGLILGLEPAFAAPLPRHSLAADLTLGQALSARPATFAIRAPRLAVYHALVATLLLIGLIVPAFGQTQKPSENTYPHLHFPTTPQETLQGGPMQRLIDETRTEWTTFQNQHITSERRYPLWPFSPSIRTLSFQMDPLRENGRAADNLYSHMVNVALNDLGQRRLQLHVDPKDIENYQINPHTPAARQWVTTQFLPQYFALYNLFFEHHKLPNGDLGLNDIVIRPVREQHPVHVRTIVGDVDYQEITLGPSLIPSWSGKVDDYWTNTVEETINDQQVMRFGIEPMGSLATTIVNGFSQYPAAWKGEMPPDNAPGTLLQHLGYALVGQAVCQARHGATDPLPPAALAQLLNQLKAATVPLHEGLHIAHDQGRMGPSPEPSPSYGEFQSEAAEGTDPNSAAFIAGTTILTMTTPQLDRNHYAFDPHGKGFVFLTNHLLTILYNANASGKSPIHAFAELPRAEQPAFLHRVAQMAGNTLAKGYEQILDESRVLPNAFTEDVDAEFPDLPEPAEPTHSWRFYTAVTGAIVGFLGFLYLPFYVRRWRERRALARKAARRANTLKNAALKPRSALPMRPGVIPTRRSDGPGASPNPQRASA